MTIRCPLCGHSRSRARMHEGEWTVRRCAGCGVDFTWPRPEPEALTEAYDSAYYEARGVGAAGSRPEGSDAGLTYTLRRLEAVKAPGRLLEVGSGPGWMLDVARRRGWQVEGVDVSRWAAAHAREALGLTVHVGDLATLDVPPASFDAVIGTHVLEHVPDPRALLAAVHRVLVPGGALLLVVPNVASMDVWLDPVLRRETLDLPWHQFHFCRRTLRALLRESGFHIVHEETDAPRLLRRWFTRSGSVAPAASVDVEQALAGADRASRRWLKRVLPGRQLLVVATR